MTILLEEAFPQDKLYARSSLILKDRGPDTASGRYATFWRNNESGGNYSESFFDDEKQARDDFNNRLISKKQRLDR